MLLLIILSISLGHVSALLLNFRKSRTIKLCLHVPTPFPSPSKCPSKFSIIPMVTDTLTGRMGSRPNQPVRVSVIGIMLNFDGHFVKVNNDGHGDVTCKQSFTVNIWPLIFSEKFLNSASGEKHLYQTPLPPDGAKSCAILDPSPSVNLQIPDTTGTSYFSANIHLDRSLFAEVIPDNECLVAAIPEFHSFPEKTLPTNKFYKIRLEHCLKSAEERRWLVVRYGCLKTGQKFEEILHFPQSTGDAAFYEVDERYVTIYTHHFTEFICTVCKKSCEQRARMFIFGSLKQMNNSTHVTIRPYMCSSLYSTEIFRKVTSLSIERI